VFALAHIALLLPKHFSRAEVRTVIPPVTTLGIQPVAMVDRAVRAQRLFSKFAVLSLLRWVQNPSVDVEVAEAHRLAVEVRAARVGLREM
jgi:ABC-type sulfate transport system substrate-binding protein